MKKSTCFFICMLAVLCYCSAQSTFGISAGISSALIDAKADGVTITSDAKIGFIGGVTISTVIAKCWSFRPELNFTQKGGAINFKDEEIKDNTTLNYIELPLNLAYSTKGKFFFGAGPSFAYAVSGKYKITGMYSESGDLKLGSGDDNDFKPFEFGINFLAGWQLSNGILLMVNYNTGVTNISATNDEKDHNSYLGLRIRYMFKGKKK